MRATLLALVAWCASGCGSPPSQAHTTAEVRSGLSSGSIVLSVPNVQVDAEGECGLGCLTALLRYHGLDLDPEARTRFALEAAARGSIAAGDLRDDLRRRGFRAYLVRGQVDAVRPRGLLAALDDSLPVLVELELEGQHHYVLVCGYDLRPRCVVVMDPSEGMETLTFEAFDAAWKAAGRLMLVAAPDPSLAPRASSPEREEALDGPDGVDVRRSRADASPR